MRWHCSARRARGQKTKTRVHRRSTRVFAFPWRGGASFCVCAAAPRQATKETSAAGTAIPDSGHDRAHAARPEPRYNAKSRVDRRSSASLRLPGAEGARQATKAGNQRSQGSYPGFRPRQSPPRPKTWYNAKSRVDRSSTRVFAFPWCGGAVVSKQGRKPA